MLSLPRTPLRRGIGLPWAIVTFTLLMGFASMMVDYARVQSVKTQLQRTADAAARAAVSQLSTSIAATQNEAAAIGTANKADDSPVTIDTTNDILFGTWDTSTRTFTTLTGTARSNATAIQIICRRTAARGTAVPLLFASLIGRSSCDVSASSIAYIATSATGGPGFVGLSSFNSSGITTDSYSAAAGTYASQTHGTSAAIISNSDLTAWSSTIHGNAQTGSGHTVYGATVTGSETPMTSTLSYTTPSTPGTNNNSNITAQMNSGTGSFDGSNLSTWGAITLPGGTYVLASANISSPITFTGPVNLYVSGALNVNGSGYLATYQNKPTNLLIVCAGSMGWYPAQPFYADVFSPTGTLSMSPGSASDFYGQIIVSSWAVYNYNLHYDTSLPSHNPSGGSGLLSGGSGASTISTVQ
jgi:Flp pilus assembly protein TadG